jgi:hypothetical protein
MVMNGVDFWDPLSRWNGNIMVFDGSNRVVHDPLKYKALMMYITASEGIGFGAIVVMRPWVAELTHESIVEGAVGREKSSGGEGARDGVKECPLNREASPAPDRIGDLNGDRGVDGQQ